ncbi:MAG: hypothetical protein KDD67_01300 [Ignavibacteriae bacterium]|nr:hypothetical protein [Ignavibacteriota bacterium]MCB9216545.1 hypothetical protein [Ignavibacteria bacterium]
MLGSDGTRSRRNQTVTLSIAEGEAKSLAGRVEGMVRKGEVRWFFTGEMLRKTSAGLSELSRSSPYG